MAERPHLAWLMLIHRILSTPEAVCTDDLYYLIRDVFVATAALGSAVLWQISPETNFITAFVFGLVGTIGFAVFGRDVQKTRP